MPRVTLREISERVGCTRSTVSYALRNHPGISVPVRNRIQAVARELGWRPDAELRRYMSMVRSTGKREGQGNLAVLHNREAKNFREEFGTLPGHLNGVLRRADELGFHVDVFSLRESPMSSSRFQSVLRARGIHGLIYLDCDLQLPRDFWKLARSFACVSVGIEPRHTEVSVAVSDYLSLGQRAIQELRVLGYRRIGVVLAQALEVMVNWGFSGGVSAGLLQIPPADRLPIYLCGKRDFYIAKTEYEGVRQYMRQYKPDVMLSVDTISLSILIKDQPDLAHLPIFSLDYQPEKGALGGIDQRPEAVGMAGVNLVVAQINRGDRLEHPLAEKVSVKEGWVPAK
ncbi:LacI family DNA-binding transcriptional regulator [Nibricoccus sp. IMCC34717]|uniref:LacI family DNA-binding transcriptional regulator n=1 Tax=Nibricoccus sp. IMCC34717 TaxID=3034021 RepID=UPI00384A6084